MQLIFSQDKPILENQLPKCLPLDPRAEIPARSDASSLAYRRWLTARGVTYGATQAAA
ncbi:MAG: hypothetical protein OXI15_05600 [Chromatiales bacterium]|nr:hypothetical protein [Chromatiales bacterium]